MYEKIVPISQAVLVAFLGLLDKEATNTLQCFVTWDGNQTTVYILDEPAGTRMYVNGEWTIKPNVNRMAYEVFATSEDLSDSGAGGYTLTESVDGILRAHVRYLWDLRVAGFERCAKLMADAFDIDLTGEE